MFLPDGKGFSLPSEIMPIKIVSFMCLSLRRAFHRCGGAPTEQIVSGSFLEYLQLGKHMVPVYLVSCFKLERTRLFTPTVK